MDRDLRKIVCQIGSQSLILDQKCIGALHIGIQGELDGVHHLIVIDQRIQCDIYLRIAKMGIVQRFAERLEREVVRMDTGIILLKSEIDRIRPGIDRGTEHSHGARGGQKFRFSHSISFGMLFSLQYCSRGRSGSSFGFSSSA